MPRMSGQALSVAANSISANQMVGQQWEFLDRPTKLLFAAAAAAAGINCTLIIGGIVIINDQAISQANRFPIIPDDVVQKIAGARGRVILTFRNTTGGAIVVNWLMDVA